MCPLVCKRQNQSRTKTFRIQHESGTIFSSVNLVLGRQLPCDNDVHSSPVKNETNICENIVMMKRKIGPDDKEEDASKRGIKTRQLNLDLVELYTRTLTA